MADRIRVAQLFITFDIENLGGGHSRFAIELGKNLDPQRFEVTLCSLGFETRISQERIERLRKDGFRVIVATNRSPGERYMPFQFIRSSFRSLNEAFNRIPVDIIHSHAEFTDILAAGLKIRSYVPRIIRTNHVAYPVEWVHHPFRRALLTNFIYPLTYDCEVGINANNTARLNQRRLARLLSRSAEKIYNAVQVERFTGVKADRDMLRNTFGIPTNSFLIGSIGRLDAQKAYHDLIAAAALVLKHSPQVYFLLVGDGPLRDELEAQARALGISGHFILTGHRPDIESLLASIDLFVSSSIWEGFPTVILESMACNVPVLATGNPGTAELINHGVNGWLVPPQNTEALSQAILYLINDPQLCELLARQARIDVMNYTIENIARQYEVIYERLASWS